MDKEQQFISKPKGNTFSEMSIDTRVLYERLVKAAEDEIITYAELSNLILRKVQDCRNLLYSAIKMARREHQIVFDCIPTVGIKRLANTDIAPLISGRVLYKIKAVSKDGINKITCVDYDNLNNEQRIKHNASLSLLGVITELATQKSLAKVESKVMTKPQLEETLSIGRTLEIFRS